MVNARSKYHETWQYLCRMVLEWREREHGDVEQVVQANLMATQMLRACGLYKFWRLGSLRENPRLLQLLVDYWDPNSETFHLDGMPLSIEVEDIYFIIGLSHKGEVVSLQSHIPGSEITIDEYIDVYYVLDMEKVGRSNPNKRDPKPWVERNTFGPRQDSGIGISPPGFKAFNILCGGSWSVFVLQYMTGVLTVEQYETTTY